MSNDKVEAVERALTVLNSFQADKPVMTLSEIADACRTSIATIKRRLRRAEGRLSGRLKL